MIKVITRFNPTANGALHLGHIYSLIVNQRFAYAHGGDFWVRFDDTSQAIVIEMDRKERAKEIVKSQKEVIQWLDIEFDFWSVQSDFIDEVHEELNKWDYIFPDPYPHDLPTYVRMIGSGWIPYPYTPLETAERVVMDHMIGATHLIRGEEFATEYSLYRYYCQLFDYPTPTFIFLPRLTGVGGDISKTNGGYTIVELKAQGYTPKDITGILQKSCLNYWSDDWSLTNLKSNPRVNI
jgi:glutamyl/glutaminyl-tRNA synthetase